MIEFKNISKTYSVNKGGLLLKKTESVEANKNISFSCRPGSVHGLLGINGAGKSTALKMLSGLARPDHGQIFVDGIDVARQPTLAQSKMGIFLNSDGIYPKLTARENIRLFAAMHSIDDIEAATDRIIDELHIRPIADRRTEGFSTGQRMKVALARALVHQPKYVVLDEPTRGLDVMSIRLLREHLLSLKEKGCCVLFSCHVMQEVEKLSDELTIIHNGEVQFQGDIPAFKATSNNDDLEQAFVQAVGA